MSDGATWAAVRREFSRLQDAPVAERPALLAALPDDVRAELASLLDAFDAAPPLLADDPGGAFRPGDTVGPYRIVEEVGRGGMGTVYRVARTDGEISRTLALKVAGGRVFAPEAQRRFIRERQILAGLDHPHIVRLIDGGVAHGQRYFVMELVEGTPLPAACAARGLPVAARVRLFRQACAAIEYAHQRLVLHRDLKPGNVLVTADGQVKVLDFGIAQVIEADTLTADTRTVLHPLSFACASPEQLRGEPLSLASDVYSLGTLLYETLTGANPQYRPDAPLDEAMRRVLEDEPVPPSRVAPGVARDLDAITLKALAKAPGARYASVAALDEDLGRWLDGRPVSALPPRPWYVVSRFARRNKALTATAAALVLSIAAGFVAVTRQARIAERRFEDARALIHATIFDIQPRLEALSGTLPLRTTLIEETTKYLEAVSKDAGGNVPLLRELSSAYVQLARVQGDLSTSSLGNQQAAEDRFARARALLDEALAIEPGNADLLKDGALLHGRLAAFENLRGRGDASLAAAAAAVGFAERNLAARPGEYDAREVLAGAVFYLGSNTPAERWDERRTALGRALAIYTALAAENPGREAVRRNIGILNRHLASLHYDKERGDEALAHAREALEVSEAVLAGRPEDVALQLEVATDGYILGMVLDQVGRGADAPAAYARSRGLLEAVRQKDSANARSALLLGEVERHSAANRLSAGDLAGARAQAGTAVTLLAGFGRDGRMPQAIQWRYASALATQADVVAAEGRREAACAGYARADEQFTEADRQSSLTDMVKREFERTRAARARCAPPALH